MSVHSAATRILRRVSLGLGMATLAYAGGTFAYSTVFQRYESWNFDRQVAAAPASASADAVERTADPVEGDLVGRLEVPRVGVSVMVLQGVEDKTLVTGAGYVPGTPSPGAPGNVVIAGHRDTFFRNLEGVRPSDRIRIATVRRTYEYVVDSTEIVDPEDTSVMESRDRQELTLITCFPFYYVGSAPRRFIVHARPRLDSE